MDDIIKALLSGAEDDQILQMLAEMEDTKDTETEVSSGYVSCVRISGEPILPPVMTEQTRLEALTWRRRALDVEDRLAARRREKIAERIDDIVSKVKSSLNQRERDNPEEDIEYSVDEYQEESLNVYEVMRSNSRAADECLSNFHETRPVTPTASPKTKLEEQSPRKVTTPSPKKSPRKSPRSDSQAYDAKTAPKSFEEVKQLAKVLPQTPKSSRSIPRYLRNKQESSDMSDTDDDETNATSIRTEIMEEDDQGGFSFRSVINRNKEDYKQSLYQERSNIYDSLVSVNTVIENIKEVEVTDEDEEMRPRSRRGSFTLSKPSPVLLAFMKRMGKGDNVNMTSHEVRGEENKENASPNINKTDPRNVSSSSGKNEILEKYLASLSVSRSVQKPDIEDDRVKMSTETPEPESLSLDLRGVVAATPTPGLESKTTEMNTERTGSETFRTDDTVSRSVVLPEFNPAPISKSDATEITNVKSSTNNGSETFRTESTVSRSAVQPQEEKLSSKSEQPTPKSLQAAISSLERRQQESLGELVRQQERERHRLREQFRRQQQELMADIYKLFPGLGADRDDLEEVEAAMERSISENISRQDSVISITDNTLRDVSMTSTISHTEDLTPTNTPAPVIHESVQNKQQIISDNESVQEINVPLSDTSSDPDTSFEDQSTPVRDYDDNFDSRPLKRTGTFTKQVRPRQAVIVPQEAYSEKNQAAWAKLTAIGKGFLTRRLLRTEKVQMLMMTIKETVSCAVQLHLESEGPPSKDDLELHARLLKQIEKACLDIHDIFFSISVRDRMIIISQNRAALKEKMFRSLNNARAVTREKRLSSATKKRLKEKNSPRKDSYSHKREKALKEARHLSLKTGHILGQGLRSGDASKIRRSPRLKTGGRKIKPINTSKPRPSQANMMAMLSPYSKRSKPAWK